MESKQESIQFVTERDWRENINEAKNKFRVQQRNLSFDEKMRIAFSLSERNRQLKAAKRK